MSIPSENEVAQAGIDMCMHCMWNDQSTEATEDTASRFPLI